MALSHAATVALLPGSITFLLHVQVVDVGGGTGFCTQGVVKHVRQQNVTLIDQSPDQLNKARKKEDLQGVTIVEAGLTSKPAILKLLCNGIRVQSC